MYDVGAFFMSWPFIIFAENHWYFTAHYLQVAYMFKLLFRRHNEIELSEMKTRKARIRTFNISISVLIVVIVIMCLYWPISIFWVCLQFMHCIMFWFFAIVNLCSMYYIQRESRRPLEGIGIYGKKWLMVLYTCLLGGFCISYTFYVSLRCIILSIVDFRNVVTLIYASIVLYRLFYTCLDCLILYSFVLLSQDIDEDILNKIYESFTDSFVENHSLEQVDEEVEDRRRFARRHEEYKFIADEQVKAIMTTMSISYIKGFPKHVVGDVPKSAHDISESSESMTSITPRSLTVANERDENVFF